MSQSGLKSMSIESVMLSNHFFLCHPLLILPSIFPSIRSFPLSQLFISSGQSIVVTVAQSLAVSNSSIPWTAAHQASLSFTISRNLLKLMSIESVMPSKHLILCHPLLLLPSIFPTIRVFSNESALCIRSPENLIFIVFNIIIIIILPSYQNCTSWTTLVVQCLRLWASTPGAAG